MVLCIQNTLRNEPSIIYVTHKKTYQDYFLYKRVVVGEEQSTKSVLKQHMVLSNCILGTHYARFLNSVAS